MSQKDNRKKGQKTNMPQKDSNSQDAFEKSKEISGDWFDVVIKGGSSKPKGKETPPAEPHEGAEEN